jgi:hypothetical protein
MMTHLFLRDNKRAFGALGWRAIGGSHMDEGSCRARKDEGPVIPVMTGVVLKFRSLFFVSKGCDVST